MAIVTMDELIDGGICREWDSDRPWPLYTSPTPEALQLFRALEVTGPVFHRGKVYRRGAETAIRDMIDVIADVRLASQTPVPPGIVTEVPA